MSLVEQQSPYLVHSDRLADVVAAIQVMSTFKFSNRDAAKWEETIGRAPKSSSSWLSICCDAPRRASHSGLSGTWANSRTGTRRHAYDRAFALVSTRLLQFLL